MKDVIRVGFVGSGNFSVFHNSAIKKCRDAELVGLWNRTEHKRQQMAAEFGCVPFESSEKLINSPEIDAVFILTNLETHIQYATMALEAGKNVFVEKPVAERWEEVEELNSKAKRKNLICMPGHNMIYEQGITRIRQLIEGKKLGNIVSIYVMYNMFHSEEIANRYPGVIRQILTHNLYSLLYLGGLPRKVSALKETLHYTDLTREDICGAILQMDSGALAHVSASFAADDVSSDPWTFIIKVIGTRGSARYSYQDWVELGCDGYHSNTFSAYQGTVDNEVRHFIDLCRYGGEPLSTLDDATTAQKVLEAVEASIREERTITLNLRKEERP